jgi:hypothetical protein
VRDTVGHTHHNSAVSLSPHVIPDAGLHQHTNNCMVNNTAHSFFLPSSVCLGWENAFALDWSARSAQRTYSFLERGHTHSCDFCHMHLCEVLISLLMTPHPHPHPPHTYTHHRHRQSPAVHPNRSHGCCERDRSSRVANGRARNLASRGSHPRRMRPPQHRAPLSGKELDAQNSLHCISSYCALCCK